MANGTTIGIGADITEKQEKERLERIEFENEKQKEIESINHFKR